jgi:PEGA domain
MKPSKSRFWSAAVTSALLLITFVFGFGTPALAAPGAAPAVAPEGRAVSDADKAKARVLFKQGIGKFDDGYYQGALSLFFKALALYPNPKIHTRIAQCHKWLGNNLKALEHYELYLKSVPKMPTKPRNRVLYIKIKTEVKNLRSLISQVQIDITGPAGAEVRINGQLVGAAPLSRLIRLKPGAVNITAISKGFYTFKRDLKLFPSQTQTVKIKMIKIKTKIIIKAAKPVWKRWWFWTAIGVVVAGTTGLAVGLTVSSTERPLNGIPVLHDALNVRW